MVYAYDLWAQMPVRDLYDSGMMQIAINAAKDMYDEGRLEIKDFRKEYGDFYSPFQSDRDWYNQNFNVANKLGEIYARGGDPLRNATDRAELYRWINSRPYAEYASRSKQASDYDTYRKNMAELDAKGLFNPDFEQSILGYRRDGTPITAENWDFNTDGPWKRLSPSVYQDVNQAYGHIFDKMDDSYMGYDPKTGMDYYGVSPERRREALITHMSDILNTDLGRYHYNNAKAALAKELGRMPTEKEAYDRFLNDVIAGTSEYDHRTQKENPNYARQQSLKNSIALENLKFSHQKQLSANRTEKDQLGMKSGIKNTGLTVLAGTSTAALWGRQIKPNMRNIFNSGYETAGLSIAEDKKGLFGLPVYNTTERSNGKVVAKFGPGNQTWDVFRNYITSRLSHPIEPSDFPEYMGAAPLEGKELFGVIQLTRNHIGDLYNTDDIITHSYGYSGAVVGSRNIRNRISQNIENGVNYEVIPSNESMTTMDRATGTIDTYYKVRLNPTPKDGEDKNNYDAYTIWIKDRSISTPANNTRGTDPVTNLDVDERNMDIARTRSIKLDRKYGASMNNGAEFPVTGTWTGYGGNIYYPETISDDYFYPNLNK